MANGFDLAVASDGGEVTLTQKNQKGVTTMLLRSKRLQAATLAMSAVLVFAAGCGRSTSPDLALVHGTVTLDGQPLAGARVEFNPAVRDASPKRRSELESGSFAITDEEGYYVLTYGIGHEGAVRGQHTVKISTRNIDAETPESRRERVPAVYNVKSRLKFTVENGENVADFPLQTSYEVAQ